MLWMRQKACSGIVGEIVQGTQKLEKDDVLDATLGRWQSRGAILDRGFFRRKLMVTTQAVEHSRADGEECSLKAFELGKSCLSSGFSGSWMRRSLIRYRISIGNSC